MVIQRIQTVFLLLAVIAIVFFTCLPMASVGGVPVHPYDAVALLITNSLVAIILFLAIFMFKNLRRQKTVTMVAMLLITASIVTSGIMLFKHDPDVELEIGSSILLLIASLVFAILAYRGMNHDEKLLKSYDRLR